MPDIEIDVLNLENGEAIVTRRCDFKAIEEMQSLLRQIAVQTDPVWGRQLARNYFGMGSVVKS